MSTTTPTSRGGDYLGLLLQEAKALRKPHLVLRNLSLLFVCWLLPNLLDH